MVEGARLLSVCRALNSTEGSNPSLSVALPENCAALRAMRRIAGLSRAARKLQNDLWIDGFHQVRVESRLLRPHAVLFLAPPG